MKGLEEINEEDVCIAMRKGRKIDLHCLCIKEGDEGPRRFVKKELVLVNELVAEDMTREINKKAFPQVHRSVLVIINPFSGRGNAIKIWEKKIQPILQSCCFLDLNVIKTMKPGHATEIISECESPFLYSVLLVIGGDGLLNEVINGLFSRHDWKGLVQNVQIAPVAAGSGNAFSHTLYRSSDPIVSALHVLKGKTKSVDAFLSLQQNPTTQQQIQRFGVMSISAGILADSDFNSEYLRMIGEARFFAVGSLYVLLGKKLKCKLHYLPTQIQKTEWFGVTCKRNCPLCEKVRHMRLTEQVIPGVNPTSSEDEVAIPDKFKELFAHLHLENNALWKTMELEVPYIVLAKTRFISASLDVAPMAHFSDGCIDICFASASEMSRFGLAGTLLLGFQNGSHTQDPRTVYLKVNAFILEPSDKNTKLGVDGELQLSSSLHVLVAQSILNFSCFE